MIPVSLKLRNFMAYRDADLSFVGIHLAALTGQNGAGKSSLLDAITWAVWGRARARRDDELIRLGESEMEVEYTFVLNDETYRVVRKRDSSKRGRSSLDFFVEDAGGWRTLSEGSLRATEKKINWLMRLDYNTFINSAFLLQGRADEFTTKRPAERKKILADILGLELYDLYADRAKRLANEKQGEVRDVEGQIKRIEEELAREPEYRTDLEAAQREEKALLEQLQQAEEQLEKLRTEHRAINDKQRQLEDLRERLASMEADLKEIAETEATIRAEIERYDAVLAQKSDIEAGAAQLQQAQAALKDWDNRLQESAKLSQRRHELESAFQAAQAALEADLREATTTINHLSPKVTAIERTQKALAEANAELTRLQALDKTLAEQRDSLAQLGEEGARLAEQNKQLKLEMEEIRENLTQLQTAGSTCPVCQRPLDEPHRQTVEAQFKADGTSRGDQYRANITRQKTIEAEQKTAQADIKAAEKQLRQLASVQSKAARLEQTLQEATEAAGQLAAAQERQQTLQGRLDRKEFAGEVLAELAGVDTELKTLGYDSHAHSQARAEVESLRRFEEEQRRLAEAGQRLPEAKKRLAREQTRREKLAGQSATDRERIGQLEEETAGFEALTKQLNEASAALDKLQQDERFAREKKIRARQMLDYVAGQAKERAKKDEQLQQLREGLGLYRELQTAFGKKGVQALLIEGAIPEIENEANQLLSRMTDGRMHVRFETQREAKSSDSTIETLDILISDEVGTRDYELYSGGEAFRINFAIRIAISKVLARRAGARLQTLMIDEGFGTQDAQGRERLVEAINAIQDDFEKLIVITHIDELKDAFPVRIDVWKTMDGSQIALR